MHFQSRFMENVKEIPERFKPENYVLRKFGILELTGMIGDSRCIHGEPALKPTSKSTSCAALRNQGQYLLINTWLWTFCCHSRWIHVVCNQVTNGYLCWVLPILLLSYQFRHHSHGCCMLLHIQLPLWDVPAVVNDYGEVKDEVILTSSAKHGDSHIFKAWSRMELIKVRLNMTELFPCKISSFFLLAMYMYIYM